MLWSSSGEGHATFITLSESVDEVVVEERHQNQQSASEMSCYLCDSLFSDAEDMVRGIMKRVAREEEEGRERAGEREEEPVSRGSLVRAEEIESSEEIAWVYVMEVPLVVKMKDGTRLRVFQVRCVFLFCLRRTHIFRFW